MAAAATDSATIPTTMFEQLLGNIVRLPCIRSASYRGGAPQVVLPILCAEQTARAGGTPHKRLIFDAFGIHVLADERPGVRPDVPEVNVVRWYAEGLGAADLYLEEVPQSMGAKIDWLVENGYSHPRCVLLGYSFPMNLPGYSVIAQANFTLAVQDEFAEEVVRCVRAVTDA